MNRLGERSLLGRLRVVGVENRDLMTAAANARAIPRSGVMNREAGGVGLRGQDSARSVS